MSVNAAFSRTRVALAIVAAFGSGAVAMTPTVASAANKNTGTYVTGDFHNHTTCSDGSISVQKLVRKSTGTGEGNYGLDWFVQAGHGGSGNRNCTLVEDDSLSTPAYPFISGTSPNTTWANSIGAANVKGDLSGSVSNPNMWRWQSVQEYVYPTLEYLSAYQDKPLFLGLETNGPGHEHISMSVITGQIPAGLNAAELPTTPGPITQRYAAVGNADALAQFEYCFDRGDTDTSRGATNNWSCAVPGSLNEADPSWNATGQKLIPASGAGTGLRGHAKTIESLKWMAAFHPEGSYYVPAHLERPGPFNPDGNNGYNIEHLRDFNNAAPNVAFGFETQPGHGASDNRGEYQVLRNNFGGTVGRVDSVGGTTYGGTGVYGAQVGGVWDALLGEGRNWWFFASSDWHNRGMFGPDDRRTSQDFLPGEYQRNFTLVKTKAGKPDITPRGVVDGLRSGNNFASSGQLVDRLAFVACASYKNGGGFVPNAAVEAHAMKAAKDNTSVDVPHCATMGEKLQVRPGAEIVVSLVVRDPQGHNNSPYTFANPSLKQIGVTQPMNMPEVDHIDLIRGMVTGYKQPGSPDYYGEWPRNTDWLRADGTTAGLSVVPAGAKNTSAAVVKTFGEQGSSGWQRVHSAADNADYLRMTYRIPAVQSSQYVRVRGTNLPPAVPYETDADGNPLADVYTNASNPARLTIPCTTPHSAGSQFDGCPDHLATATAGPIAGQKAVSYDVAAWADLWFYSNPIYVEVDNGVKVAGVK